MSRVGGGWPVLIRVDETGEHEVPLAEGSSHHSGPVGEAGVTLLELLVAVSLVALLSVGMAIVLRIALDGSKKAQDHITADRRVLGVDRVLREQISNMMPAVTPCRSNAQAGAQPMPLFEGLPGAMRLVSNYSMAEAGRGLPRLLEYQVIPGDAGAGVRLVVNEIPWTGPSPSSLICDGLGANPENGFPFAKFVPIQVTGNSFILADHLAYCHLLYLETRLPPELERWVPQWQGFNQWPSAIRVDMAPLSGDMSHLQLSSVTVPIRTQRDFLRGYTD